MFHPLLDKLSTLLQKMSSAVSTIGGIPRDIPAVRTAKRRRGSSRAERLFRSLAVVILAGSAIILSTVTFALSKDKEQNDFNTQFASCAEQVAEGFRSNFQSRLLALDSFSIAMTSYVHSSKLNWPLVTIPDFAVRGWASRQQMKAETLGLLPLVTEDHRAAWEAYAVDNQEWVQEARAWEKYQTENPPSLSRSRSLRGIDPKEKTTENESQPLDALKLLYKNGIPSSRQLSQDADFSEGVSSRIYTVAPDGRPVVDEGKGPFTPIWMTSPAPPELTNINFNLLSHPILWPAIEIAIDSHQAVLSKVLNLETRHDSITSAAMSLVEPISSFYYPVFDDFLPADRALVGILASELAWTHFLEGALPSSAQGIICVIENSCSQAFTYRLDGARAKFLGPGDLHDPSYDDMVERRSLGYLTDVPEDFAGARLNFGHCPFTLHVYPSEDSENEYHSKEPVIFASSVMTLFFISAAIFFVYDNLNGKREGCDDQSVVMLERMFPLAEVRPSLRKRILSKLQRGKPGKINKPRAAPPHFKATIQALPAFIGIGKNKDDPFSNATVLFADIAGLDAWSAGRGPDEKDTLLETVHRSLNVFAKRHGIFQVEMAGDCFVAVTGVQETEDDHAAIMAHFACDCRKKIHEVFKSMQAKGLSMRFGLHSGHVQAGLYGDENSRYQLFGDTVDTTYQMLSNGKPNKIQLSVETAELLNLAGKSHWMAPRKDLVLVRGKGEMSTFWIKPKACLAIDESKDAFSRSDTSAASDSTMDESDLWDTASTGSRSQSGESKFQSVVDRNVSLLLPYLKKIRSRRNARRNVAQRRPRDEDTDLAMGNPIIEEARENVRMPAFDARISTTMMHNDLVDLPEEVESQLRLYVSSIASTYRANEFHNVEHATHVTGTMDRMMKKITASDEPDTYMDFGGKPRAPEAVAYDLDSRTFGIASDPLSQFALMFATLVHDVDHVGVSNFQLVKEESPIASLYKNRSVAEQNSVDIAWWLLMTPNFSELRAAIYGDATEMRRFRQLLVNSVIATDILDRDLKVHRDKGWKKAFRKAATMDATASEEMRDLQATVVIEHLVQAADAAHTMQSFRTYLKWSEKLFGEMYQAHHAGRADKDPAESWYAGELAFFDKFVIPLATRLRDCGIFGGARTGEEYLRMAIENRRLWASNGQNILRDMVEGFSRKIVASQEDTIMFS